MEAFSDGVFAIAITLLVLDFAIHPPGSAAPPGAPHLAVVRRLPRQLPDDRRGMARPHRADRPARAHRLDLPAHQPAAPARRHLPSVPNRARRRGTARTIQRARVRDHVRTHTARDPTDGIRPRRVRRPRTPLHAKAATTRSHGSEDNFCPSSPPMRSRSSSDSPSPCSRSACTSASPCTSSFRSERSDNSSSHTREPPHSNAPNRRPTRRHRGTSSGGSWWIRSPADASLGAGTAAAPPGSWRQCCTRTVAKIVTP